MWRDCGMLNICKASTRHMFIFYGRGLITPAWHPAFCLLMWACRGFLGLASRNSLPQSTCEDNLTAWFYWSCPQAEEPWNYGGSLSRGGRDVALVQSSHEESREFWLCGSFQFVWITLWTRSVIMTITTTATT